jgi:hypothetical protein
MTSGQNVLTLLTSAMITNAMERIAAFPLYVRLDDGEVLQIESVERILYHLEAIDIENGEYMFWDAGGLGLKILIEKGRVIGFANAENKITLQRAFDEYVQQLGVDVDTTGTPQEIWDTGAEGQRRTPTSYRFLFMAFRQEPKIVGDKSPYHSLRQPRSVCTPPHRWKLACEAETISCKARGLPLPDPG